jgi:hypothetical protein
MRSTRELIQPKRAAVATSTLMISRVFMRDLEPP